MTTKEYLEQAIGIQERINSIREQINTCPEENEFVRMLKTTCKEYENFQFRVFQEIHRVKDNRLAALLEERYINGHTWENVTERLGFDDTNYVRKQLHIKALREFEKNTPVKARKSPQIPFYST